MKTVKRIQDMELKGKKVLMRVDHNVVKKGKIMDPYRIDASLPTIKHIINEGGKLILMSHIGRPKDKSTGLINISEKTSVEPVVKYLLDKGIKIARADFSDDADTGIKNVDKKLVWELLNDNDAVYLPNTRWFAGEEAKDENRNILGKELAELADIYINDAFGSWQPHASTIVPAEHIPAAAGILMQKEIDHLQEVLEPQRPFLAVVAGSKFDTKIKPLSALLKSADHLLLGGVIFNAYLSVKYDINIKGVSEADKIAASDFVKLAGEYKGKVLEPLYIIESDTLEAKEEGRYRKIKISDLQPGASLNYVLDIAEDSFDQPEIKEVFAQAGTIFVNAVMGLTPHFAEGTIALDEIIAQNKSAKKLFGGGDTLSEFKTLLPELYMKALHDEKYYFFTGGGTILKAIAEGSAWGLEPVQALLK